MISDYHVQKGKQRFAYCDHSIEFYRYTKLIKGTSYLISLEVILKKTMDSSWFLTVLPQSSLFQWLLCSKT